MMLLALQSDYFSKQAGTGPSRRHIQGSKVAKGLPSVNLQYSKIEKPKKVDREGPLLKLSTFLSQLKGGPFAEKTNFRKKSLNAEKQKGGPSGFLNPHSVVKPFGEKKTLDKKSHIAEKS